MIRKNVTLDDESMERLKKLSGELGMNHSECVRHLLGKDSGQSPDRQDYYPRSININGHYFMWNGVDSYVMLGKGGVGKES